MFEIDLFEIDLFDIKSQPLRENSEYRDLADIILTTESFAGRPQRELKQVISKLEAYKEKDFSNTKALLLASLKVHMDVVEPTREDPGLEDSPSVLKLALDYYGLKTSKRFFETLERDDLVEIYTLDHFQIFRTFNFYKLSNYSLEDILLNEWYKLYKRPAHVTDQLMAHVNLHLEQNLEYSEFDIEPHIMSEIFAQPKGTFLTKFKSLTTTYDLEGQRTGFACSMSAKALEIDDTRNLEILSRSCL